MRKIAGSRPARIGLALAVSVLAMLTASCMTAEQPEARTLASSGSQCFLASRAIGFRAIDQDSVLVFVGARRVYELQISNTCPRIDWATRVAIRSTTGGPWVCPGLNAELFVPNALAADRCPVLGVRELSPEEARMARGRPS